MAKVRTGRVLNMTEGKPLPMILAFALPFLIGNIFQQIYSMVDTVVVGYHLGDSAIAAIGASDSLYNLIINTAIGLNSGYGIVVTRYFGARDYGSMRKSLSGMIALNLSITALLTLLSLIFLRPILAFMNTPEAIFESAYSYIAVICGGMIATVCYNMFAAIMRAVGNSRAPLVFLVISSLLNVVLDLFFVVVLDTGVAGAAIATVIAQGLSAVISGLYVWKCYREYLPRKSDLKLPHGMLGELFSTGLAMALMAAVVDLGSVILNRSNNLLGEGMIAANTAGRRIWKLMLMPQNAIAAASSTFMAQNWGARKVQRIRSALKQVLATVSAWSVFACLLFFVIGEALIRYTTGTSDPEIIKGALLLTRSAMVCAPALGILVCLRNTLQALGSKVVPVLSSCIELVMKIISAKWAIPAFGFTAMALTEPVTWVLMMIFLLCGYGANYKKMIAAQTPGEIQSGE